MSGNMRAVLSYLAGLHRSTDGLPSAKELGHLSMGSNAWLECFREENPD
jgi:hypothetical protein